MVLTAVAAVAAGLEVVGDRNARTNLWNSNGVRIEPGVEIGLDSGVAVEFTWAEVTSTHRRLSDALKGVRGSFGFVMKGLFPSYLYIY